MAQTLRDKETAELLRQAAGICFRRVFCIFGPLKTLARFFFQFVFSREPCNFGALCLSVYLSVVCQSVRLSVCPRVMYLCMHTLSVFLRVYMSALSGK
jgi:hypothetical protein